MEKAELMSALVASLDRRDDRRDPVRPRPAARVNATAAMLGRPETLSPAAVHYLQRRAGNAAVAGALGRKVTGHGLAVQRCGPVPCDCTAEERAAHAAEEQAAGGGASAVQRTIGDGHDLCSPRFAGDLDLEACYDDEARLTVDGRGQPGTTKIESGAGVASVQHALIDLGYLSGAATGIYNQATWDAVRRLKRTEHLGWEGMGDVGPGTMAFLNTRFTPPCPHALPSPPCPPCASPEQQCPPCPAPGQPAPDRPPACAPCPSGPRCGPDATDWFVRQVNTALGDPAVRVLRVVLTEADVAARRAGTSAQEITEGGAAAATLLQERSLGSRAPARNPTISGQLGAGTAAGARAAAALSGSAHSPLRAAQAVKAIALVGAAALIWKRLVDHGARYDFKAHADSMNHPHGAACPDERCNPGEVGIITLCPGTIPENCYESDLPGNLFYALIGRFVGWSELTLQLGSQLAELTDVTPRPSRPAVTWDSPEDTSAINVGFGLPLPLTVSGLCAVIPGAHGRLDARTGCEDCTSPTTASIH